MPDETLQELKRKLDKLFREDQMDNTDPNYQAFLETVTNTITKMSALNTRDRYGRLPYMSAEDRAELMRLHREIGTKAEVVFRNEADKTRRELVKKITALAAGNHRALMSYDPAKKQKTLLTLLSEVRTLTLDTRGVSLQSQVSNQSNVRQPITFLDNRGKPITGVFTPRKHMNVRGNLQETIDRIKEQVRDPVGLQILDKFYDKLIAWGAKEEKTDISQWPEERKPAMLDPFLQWIGDGDKKEILNRDDMKDAMETVFADELQGASISSKIPKKLLWQLGQAICDESTNINVNIGSGKIPDGSRLDNRNAAMSAMADMLGVPMLLARSRPMKLIMPDGKEVEGTFMAEANGLDPKNLDERAEGIDRTAFEGKTPEDRQTVGMGLKALADLQVVDYLCGNVDRNYGNMLYQFSNKIFCGTQAIDNDCALGLTRPKADQTEKEMASLNNMKVISQTMYDAVKGMTPDTLRFCLHGFGLSEQELDAAAYRLEELKQKLRFDREIYAAAEGNELIPNCIKVVKDEEWPKLKLIKLAAFEKVDGEREPANIFATAGGAIANMGTDYANQKKAYRSLKSDVAIGTGNRAIPKEQAKEEKKAADLLKLLNNRTTQGRSSPQYDDMLKAVKNYSEFQTELMTRMAEAKKNADEPDALYDSIVSTQELEKMRKLARTVQEKADAYLEHKGGGLHFGYTAKRIDAAKLARELGRSGAAYNRMEQETAESNMREAIEEVNRRVGDRLEAQNAVPNAHLGKPAQQAGR